MNFRHAIFSGALVCAWMALPMAAQPQKMSPELLWKLGRLGAATVSPNEKVIAYTVRNYELKKNAGRSTLYLQLRESGKTVGKK